MKTLKHLKLAAAATALLFLAGSGAHAQQAQAPTASNHTISYQGTIVEMDGSAVKDSTYPITVSIWTDATQGTRLWRDVFPTEVKGGIFNILLGSHIPLPSPALMDQPLWLGVSFNTDLENLPRFPLGTVTMSLNVADSAITTRKLATGAVGSANLADSAVTTDKLADGAVTWNKMGTEYIPYIRVNGAKVTTGHNPINFTGGNGLTVNYDSTTMSVIVQPDTALLTGTDAKGTKAQTWDPANGGSSNTSPGTDDFIGGGNSNTINIGLSYGGENAITGGQANFIGRTSDHNFIGGGHTNKIYSFDETLDGDDVGLTIDNNTIGGGTGNNIGTLDPDLMTAPITANFIGGGTSNLTNSINAVIGGGGSNTANGMTSAILGGSSNTTNGATSVIGGGSSNTANGATSAIVGGSNNKSPGSNAFVGAGDHNNASGSEATIVGGTGHTASGTTSFIGGGNSNTASNSSTVVAGGWLNIASGNVSAVLGGDHDTAAGEGSTIGGGTSNTIDIVNTNGEYSAIAGGGHNQAGRMTFVGGGWFNDATGAHLGIPTPNIDQSATLGGTNLFTDGQDQVVIGCSNLPSGHGHFTISPGMPNDDRIFEIGSPYDNGITWVQNNAFEVSYNGHSIVTQTLGQSLLGTPVLQGATYVESPVYAWGEVDGSSGNVVGTSSFGITQSLRLDPVFTSTPGTYMVTLVPADPHGFALPDLSQCSITVTIDNDYTADITRLPPPPPQAPVRQPDVRQVVPDSVILALCGTLSNPDTSGNSGSTVSPNSPQQPPSPPAFTCGFATASAIGVLGSSYPYSFIVRTFTGGEAGCNDYPLTFFFKVCHR